MYKKRIFVQMEETNMNKNHLIAAALLLTTVLGTAACGSADDSGTVVTDAAVATTAAVQETEPVETRMYDGVPDKDYGGKTFDILTAGNWNNEWTEIYDFQAEEENGEPINDAVFKRNVAIEERFHVDGQHTMLHTQLIVVTEGVAIPNMHAIIHQIFDVGIAL